MSIFEKIKQAFRFTKKDIPKQRQTIEPVSIYYPQTSITQSKLLNPRFPYEYLTELENLVLTNPDLAHAHQIFLDLANRGFDIIADENIKEEVESFAEKIKIRQLSRQLFNQLILYGAVSLEWIVEPNYSGIQKAVRVPVWTIRFIYDENEDKFIPYQWLPPKEPIRLSPLTYQYIPLLTLDGSPYGIPPFIAVFKVKDVQEEVLEEIKAVAKKLGLLGFIDVKVPQPPKLSGETETEYRKRLIQQLQEEAPAYQEQIQKGVVIHYDGTEINFKEIPNASIGKDMIEVIERFAVSATKMQPSLLGRTTGSTETWATIAYEQFVSQLEDFQSIVQEVLEYGIKLHLTLKGLEYKTLEIQFDPPPSLNPEKEEQAKKIRTDRVIAELQSKLITPEEARKQLGYDPQEIDFDED